jgi:hypothetical protein
MAQGQRLAVLVTDSLLTEFLGPTVESELSTSLGRSYRTDVPARGIVHANDCLV